jgi:VPDSG-CTERM motif
LARPLLLSFTNLKIPMTINKKYLIPKLVLGSVAVCALMFAFTSNANAVTNLNFNQAVGTVTPGAPANETVQASYINFMIGLGLGQSDTFAGQTITRSNNVFANLPTAIVGPSSVVNPPQDGNGLVHIQLGAVGTFSYLYAKYDGQNDLTQVWYVGNLGGEITIPFLGPLGHGISHYTLYGPGGNGVPDGGTTLMLLGMAFGSLGMARRFLKI